MIDQRQQAFDAAGGRHVRQGRAGDHHHLNTERARRGDLAVGGLAATVLADDGVDTVVEEQLSFVGFGKRAAGENIAGVRHIERGYDRIDAAHEIAVLRRGTERACFLPAERKEDPALPAAQCENGSRNAVRHRPAVADDARPSRTTQGEQADTGARRRVRRVGGHARGVGMGRVDQQAGRALPEKFGETVHAAEAAVAGPDALVWRSLGAASQRKQNLGIRALRQPQGDPARFAGTAENKNAVGHDAC